MGGDALSAEDAVRRLALLAVAPPADILSLSPVELDLAIRVWRRVRLLGRVAWRLREAGLLEQLPMQAIDQLESALVTAESRRRMGLWELNRLAWALEGLGDVPLVALKGCAYLLAGTPNAHGRMFGDVDLLVPEASLPAAESLLKERGWQLEELTPYDERYYRLWAHELPPMSHVEREVEVDLHHNILMRTARLKPSPALLLESARPVPDSGIKVLAPVDMVLHAMAHLFYGGEMDDALRELIDIDELLRYFAATEPGFWEQFWPRAEQLGLARPAFYGLRYSNQLLGTPVPQAVTIASTAGAPPGPLLALMDRLIPLALIPRYPDRRAGAARAARLALYLRSHWVKMPAGMLVKHLFRKSFVR